MSRLTSYHRDGYSIGPGSGRVLDRNSTNRKDDCEQDQADLRDVNAVLADLVEGEDACHHRRLLFWWCTVVLQKIGSIDREVAGSLNARVCLRTSE